MGVSPRLGPVLLQLVLMHRGNTQGISSTILFCEGRNISAICMYARSQAEKIVVLASLPYTVIYFIKLRKKRKSRCIFFKNFRCCITLCVDLGWMHCGLSQLEYAA